MKNYLRFALTFAVLLWATVAVSAQEPRLNNKPVPATLLDSVHKRFRQGDATALNDLADTNSKKAVPYLMEYIVPQSNPGDADATAAGSALARMHSEQYLHDLIVKHFKDGESGDRDRILAFQTLSFMQSRAAVRTLASFLDDTATIPGDVSSLAGTNADYAVYALARMGLLHAPLKPTDPQSLTAEAADKWRQWWKSNAANFKGDGPLPSE